MGNENGVVNKHQITFLIENEKYEKQKFLYNIQMMMMKNEKRNYSNIQMSFCMKDVCSRFSVSLGSDSKLIVVFVVIVVITIVVIIVVVVIIVILSE